MSRTITQLHTSDSLNSQSSSGLNLNNQAHRHPLIDIGVNLTHKRFDRDRSEIIARAFEQGIVGQLITGVSVKSSEDALAMCLETEWDGVNLWSTAGVHPHDSAQVESDWEERLSALLTAPSVVAVGECGLDYDSAM